MSRILTFLAGVVFSVVVVGGLAAWFLFLSPEAEKAKVAPVAAPATPTAVSGREIPRAPVPPGATSTGTGTSTGQATMNFPSVQDQRAAEAGAVPQIFVEGRVSFPPALRKLVEKHPKAALAFRFVPSTTPSGRANLVSQGPIAKISYPFSYRFEIDRAWVPSLQKFVTFPLLVRVVVCLEYEEKGRCIAQLPNVEGTMRFSAKIPAGAKGSLAIPVPTLVMTRYQPKPDSAACNSSGGKISGVLQPTPAFTKAAIKRVLVIGSPYHDRAPPAPFTGPPGSDSVLKPSAAELASADKVGITWTAVNIQGNANPFSLSVPDSFRSELYRLYYVACPPDKDDKTCLAGAFPLNLLQVPKEGVRTVVALVAQGFEAPSCGMKDRVFYAHVFDRNAGMATEESVHMANPPEIIEGAVY